MRALDSKATGCAEERGWDTAQIGGCAEGEAGVAGRGAIVEAVLGVQGCVFVTGRSAAALGRLGWDGRRGQAGFPR